VKFELRTNSHLDLGTGALRRRENEIFVKSEKSKSMDIEMDYSIHEVYVSTLKLLDYYIQGCDHKSRCQI
jgi:hypothetical protein